MYGGLSRRTAMHTTILDSFCFSFVTGTQYGCSDSTRYKSQPYLTRYHRCTRGSVGWQSKAVNHGHVVVFLRLSVVNPSCILYHMNLQSLTHYFTGTTGYYSTPFLCKLPVNLDQKHRGIFEAIPRAKVQVYIVANAGHAHPRACGGLGDLCKTIVQCRRTKIPIPPLLK